MFCGKCGNNIPEGHQFCYKCGAAVYKAAPTQPRKSPFAQQLQDINEQSEDSSILQIKKDTQEPQSTENNFSIQSFQENTQTSVSNLSVQPSKNAQKQTTSSPFVPIEQTVSQFDNAYQPVNSEVITEKQPVFQSNNIQQPAYQYPTKTEPATISKNNSKKTSSGLVLSILALVVFWLPVLNILFSVSGLIISIIGLTKKNSSKVKCIISLILAGLAFLLSVNANSSLGKNKKEANTQSNASVVVETTYESQIANETTHYDESTISQENDLVDEVIWNTSYTPISDFRYSIENDEIILLRYIGDDDKILLSPYYIIDGTDYPLVSLGDDACFLCETRIKSVYIPEGVTHIGNNTFNSCSSLKNIYIPSTVENLDSSFFGYLYEYEVIYDASVDIDLERDTREYTLNTEEISDAELLGEDAGRAVNGLFAGIGSENDDSLLIIYYGGSQDDWNSIADETNRSVPAGQMSEEEFIDSCEEYSADNYEDILRNPNSYKNVNIQLSGSVDQIIEGWFGIYTIYLEDWEGNKWEIMYYYGENESHCLEGDYITVYGTLNGTTTATTVLGKQVTMPFINGEYIY